MRDILGQGRAISTLAAAMQSGRLHHAWIFHGPSGVGKFTTALAFAAAILDPTTKVNRSDNLPTPEPGSAVQRLLSSGTHPDLHIITKELAAFSDDQKVRDGKRITIAKDVVDTHLIQPAGLAPGMSVGGMASKVFIVDEAELLDRSPFYAPVQNSILKTLEEPSAGNVIILVTSAEDRLLPTIRSRCQRVAFGRLDSAGMNMWMQRASAEVPKESAAWLLQYADGSPGDLLRGIQTGIPEWHHKLGPMLSDIERGRASAELGAAMAALIEAEAQRVAKASPNASKEAANKTAADAMFRLVAEHFRGGLRGVAGGSGGGGSGGTGGGGQVRRIQARLRCIDLIAEAERQMDSNVQALFVCSNLVAQMCVTMEAAAAG
ncbi:MAG: AAA family ATPase [Phycisphaerales bacterium]|nr:AAA family ATPase [Phycisphaerales bacterium]